jgi:hypothetical protein
MPLVPEDADLPPLARRGTGRSGDVASATARRDSGVPCARSGLSRQTVTAVPKAGRKSGVWKLRKYTFGHWRRCGCSVPCASVSTPVRYDRTGRFQRQTSLRKPAEPPPDQGLANRPPDPEACSKRCPSGVDRTKDDNCGWGMRAIMGQSPFGKQVCCACRTLVEAIDYIFTSYPQR